MANTLGTRVRHAHGDGDGETFIAHALTSEGHDASEDGTGRGTPLVASTLKAQQGRGWAHDAEATYIAAPLSHGSNPNSNAAGRRREDDENLVAYALRKDPGGIGQGHNTNYATDGASVRRLTPTECERLQALPDGWTQLGDTADSPRYAALGDAVTASVAEWVGRRLVGSIR